MNKQSKKRKGPAVVPLPVKKPKHGHTVVPSTVIANVGTTALSQPSLLQVQPCILTANPLPAVVTAQVVTTPKIINLDASNAADQKQLQGFTKSVVTTKLPVLQPNTEFHIKTPDVATTGVSHEAIFITNQHGQPTTTKFKLDKKSVRPANTRIATSNQTAPLGAPTSGIKTDIGFHAMGDQFHGAPYYPNLDPGDTDLNNRDYKSLEMKLGKAAKKGITSEVEVVKTFSSPTSVRPDAFTVHVDSTKPDGTKLTYNLQFPNEDPRNDPNRKANQKELEKLKKDIK
jgi:hypothetical protein